MNCRGGPPGGTKMAGGATVSFNLVLYKDMLLPGNYFQIQAFDYEYHHQNDYPPRSYSAKRFTNGLKALQVLPSGRWKIVRAPSSRLWDGLVADQQGQVTLYRGANRFEFEVLSLLREVLQKPDSEKVTPATVARLRKLDEQWAIDNAWEHDNFATPVAEQYPTLAEPIGVCGITGCLLGSKQGKKRAVGAEP